MTIQSNQPVTPETDPYAPPPRHKDSSGKLVRVVILAGVLGVLAAGYAFYSDEIEQASNTPMIQEEQQFAEAPALPAESPQPAESTDPSMAVQPGSATPGSEPAPAAPPSEPLAPPSTTTEPSGE